jgi:ELWxxDGT repeat protein
MRIRSPIPFLLAPARRGTSRPVDRARSDRPAAASSAGSNPGRAVVQGNVAWFAASDAYGRELWRTDGTQNGTWRLRDVNPGSASSSDPSLISRRSAAALFFVARQDGLGRELWVSDGTSAARASCSTSVPGSDVGSRHHRRGRVPGSKLWFVATTPANGTELWRSDGTDAGTQTARRPRARRPNSSAPSDLVVWNGQLWFVAAHVGERPRTVAQQRHRFGAPRSPSNSPLARARCCPSRCASRATGCSSRRNRPVLAASRGSPTAPPSARARCATSPPAAAARSSSG